MSAAIVIFTKIPSLVPCKTRLLSSSTLSENCILELSLGFLKDTISVAALTTRELFIFSNPLSSAPELRALLKIDCDFEQFKYQEQIGNTFAERLEQAAQDTFATSNSGLVIIGSDCPTLGQETLDLALTKVDRGNFVLGPSSSGGIYLIGIPKEAIENGFSLKKIFDEIKSTELERFAEEVRIFEGQLEMLPFNIDIDVEDDLISLLAYLKSCSGNIAPYTLAAIEKLGLEITRNKEDNRKLKIVGPQYFVAACDTRQ